MNLKDRKGLYERIWKEEKGRVKCFNYNSVSEITNKNKVQQDAWHQKH